MNYQTDKIHLGDLTYVAGGNFALNLKGKIQNQLRGKFPHLKSIMFEVDATPTMSSGSLTGAAIQNVVKQLRIKDNTQLRHDGGFAALRLLEALENGGRARTADPDTVATTEQASFCRVWEPLPGQLENAEGDGLEATPLWDQAIIEGTFGTLAELSATCTAMACTVKCYALVAYADNDVRLGVRSESILGSATGSAWERTDGGLYLSIGLLNSVDCDAIGNGDFNAVVITDRNGQGQPLTTEVLQRAFELEQRTGQFGNLIVGDLRASTDDNNKVANGTAIAAAAQLCQPVAWVPPRAQISKLLHEAQPNLKVALQGNGQTTFGILYRRLLPMDDQYRMAREALVVSAFGQAPSSRKLNLISGKVNGKTGARGYYLPSKVKMARASAI